MNSRLIFGVWGSMCVAELSHFLRTYNFNVVTCLGIISIDAITVVLDVIYDDVAFEF